MDREQVTWEYEIPAEPRSRRHSINVGSWPVVYPEHVAASASEEIWDNGYGDDDNDWPMVVKLWDQDGRYVGTYKVEKVPVTTYEFEAETIEEAEETEAS